MTTPKNFKLFSRDVPQELQNIATKDFASKNVEEDLLMAQWKDKTSWTYMLVGDYFLS